MSGSAPIEITGLFRYPVKSMRAVAIDQAVLLPTGLQYDRHWIVVKADGSMLTQRNTPAMARLAAGFDGKTLTIETMDGDTLNIDYAARPITYHPTNVWGDEFAGLDEGDAASKWLSEVLETKEQVRLVRAAPEKRRPQNYPTVFGEDTTTYFADATPFLVANEASLAALNARLVENDATPVPMDRFRPNIVVKGLEAFAENDLSDLADSAGRYHFGIQYPCVRCVITTIDQMTGEKSKDQEPLRTILKMKLIPEEPKKAYFAQNAILKEGEGKTICVGDILRGTLAEQSPVPRN